MLNKTILLFLAIFFINRSSQVVDQSIAESVAGSLTSLVPQKPVLISPLNNTLINGDTVQLMWQRQIHTSSFQVQVSESDDFEELILDKIVTDTLNNFTQFENELQYFWRVAANNVAGQSAFSEISSFTVESSTSISQKVNDETNHYNLEVIFPNPFSDQTQIIYYIPKRTFVSIHIFDKTGKKVKTLLSETKDLGIYQLSWKGMNDTGQKMPAGSYFCTLLSEEFTISKKIILLP